jgi:hypothetical protein
MSLQLLEPVDPQDPREQPVSHEARPAPELASLSGRVAQQAIDDETYARQTAKLDLMLLIEVWAMTRWCRCCATSITTGTPR